MQKTILLALIAFILIGCDRTTEPNESTQAVPAVAVNDRDSWQKPQELITLMDGFLQGKVVADLFAGDGYFTFKLVEQGAYVIAMDTDPANIQALETRKRSLGLSDMQLTIRHVQPGEPGLAPEEADAALIVHHFTRIANRKDYFERLRLGMKYPRPLFVVDWQYRPTTEGPPLDERMRTEDIMEELGSYQFYDVGAHSAKMPYQVIFFASDPMEMDEEEYLRQMEQVEVRPLD